MQTIQTSNPQLVATDTTLHVINTNGDEWKDWTSTWRRAGNKPSATKHVTMTGTITRGKSLGKSVDVQLDLTERELYQINQGELEINPNLVQNQTLKQYYLKNGVHVMFLGVFCFPFVLLVSFFISLYFCLLTWQNIFNHVYDGLLLQRVLICPLMIIFFPLILPGTSLSVALYAAFVQISWSFDDWKDELNSFEKGFFGWFCYKISMDQCSPYDVIEINETVETFNNNSSIALQPMMSDQVIEIRD